MYQFSVLSMNDGLIKEIAQTDKDMPDFNQKLTVLIKSYIKILGVISLVNVLILLFFSKQLTIYIFGDSKYYTYFLIGVAAFPILIANSISFAVLRGFKLIKYIARSELIVTGINLVVFIPLIYFWGLTGAVIQIVISFLSLLMYNHYYVRIKVLTQLNISVISVFKAQSNKGYLSKELLRFAAFHKRRCD